MLRRVDFWNDERDAPLLRLNRSFLPSSEILQRIKTIDDDDSPMSTVAHERIIRLDAERTFLGLAQRTTLMNVLSFLRKEFDSYHQAMSSVAGFLLLIHAPTKVIDIMRNLHRIVLGGYWNTEAIPFAIDAYVFEYLLEDFHPNIREHLAKHFILPETYAQKWFVALCVGVLPFQVLFPFFDQFLADSSSSNRFLFQFALSLMQHIDKQLLETTNVARIYQYLRLDSSLPEFADENNDVAMSILCRAKEYDLSRYDFVLLRKKAFEEKLQKRLEAANRVHKEKKEEEEEEDSCSSSSDDEETSSLRTLICDMNKLKIE